MCLRMLTGLLLTLCLLPAAFAEKPIVLLIGQSPDGHPPGTHEYMPGVRLMDRWLSATGKVETVVAQADGDWTEGPDMIAKADGIFMFVSQGARWIAEDARRYEAFAQHAQNKKGLAALHWATGTKDAKYIDGFTALFGPCHGGPDRKYKFLTTELRPVGEHPAVSGVEPLRTRGEYYYQLKLPKDKDGLVPLLEADIDGEAYHVSYAWNRPDGGRSFVFTGGHFHDNWKHLQYRRLVTQGVLWTVGVDVPADGLDIPLEEGELALPKAE